MLLRIGKEDEDGASIDPGIDPGIDTGIDTDIDPGGDPVGPRNSSSGCEINLAWVENRGEGVDGGRGGGRAQPCGLREPDQWRNHKPHLLRHATRAAALTRVPPLRGILLAALTQGSRGRR